MKKIYLATPYSHKDDKVRRERFDAVNIVAARLMRQGFLVFSPIIAHPPNRRSRRATERVGVLARIRQDIYQLVR